MVRKADRGRGGAGVGVPAKAGSSRYVCPLHGPVSPGEVEHASSEIAYHAPGGSVCGPLERVAPVLTDPDEPATRAGAGRPSVTQKGRLGTEHG